MVKIANSKEKKPKAKKSKPVPQLNFVGHITYPNNLDVYHLLFDTESTKKVDVVHNGDRFISALRLEAQLKNFLIDVGEYTVVQKTVKNTNKFHSRDVLNITCNRKSCIYYNERRGDACKIHVKTKPEIFGKRSPKLEDPSLKFLLSFNARDMRETTRKSDCIRAYVKNITGIDGVPDTYGKIASCKKLGRQANGGK